MAISQAKAITRLYSEVLSNGIVVDEDKTIKEITKSCEKKGQFIFRGDSYWSFVKTTRDNKECMRMIFAIKESTSGKVKNIDKMMELIRNIEKTLIYIDDIHITTQAGFIYIDSIKYL